MQINMDRIKTYYSEMASVGATPMGGVTRLALSSNDKKARDLLVRWFKKANLAVRIDDIGNIYGRREGTDATAKPVVLGSHLDSVINSGTYDGALGLICALEIVNILNEKNIITKRPIEILNVTNEEGFRFEHLMSGSGVLSGDYDIDEIYMDQDDEGIRLLDELKRIGYLGDKDNRLVEAEAFVELHIEQGPILSEEKIPLGVVESILGLVRYEVIITGKESDAGPTPMSMRKDALCSAAKMILEIQKSAKVLGEHARTTVGYISAEPGFVNVVPGEVKFLIDIRGEEIERGYLEKNIISLLREIANQDGMQFEIKETIYISPTKFSEEIVETIKDASNYLGYPIKEMMSGSGHISSFMNNLCPTAMVFIPSVGGKTHCPEEYTEWEDIEIGATLLLNLTYKLTER